jgi:hypothetical protein
VSTVHDVSQTTDYALKDATLHYHHLKHPDHAACSCKGSVAPEHASRNVVANWLCCTVMQAGFCASWSQCSQSFFGCGHWCGERDKQLQQWQWPDFTTCCTQAGQGSRYIGRLRVQPPSPEGAVPVPGPHPTGVHLQGSPRSSARRSRSAAQPASKARLAARRRHRDQRFRDTAGRWWAQQAQEAQQCG